MDVTPIGSSPVLPIVGVIGEGAKPFFTSRITSERRFSSRNIES